MLKYPHWDLFSDQRLTERSEIEDAIVRASEGCEIVLLNGDVFDVRNPPAEVIKHFTNFLERLGDKIVVLNSGNHENTAGGASALDFIREIKGKNWIVVNGKPTVVAEGICVVPYVRRAQYDVETDAELVEKVLEQIPYGLKAIYIHHCVSGTKANFGLPVDLMHEAIFPREELLKHAEYVFSGHIHTRQDDGNVSVIGSVMNMSLGETETKRVLVFDTVTGERTSIDLPGRKLCKLVNPSAEEMEEAAATMDYVKIVSDIPVVVPESLNGKSCVVETPKSDRKKVEEIGEDFSVPSLLKVYSKSREVDLNRLMAGYGVIKELV